MMVVLTVAVAEQLLHRADVVAILQKVRRERVAQRVGARPLGQAGSAAATRTARCKTVSCKWWRRRWPLTRSR